MHSPGPVVGFDLDMTLIDSTDAIAATMDAAIAAVAVAAGSAGSAGSGGSGGSGGEGVRVTRAQLWPYVGLPLETTVAGLAPLADADAVIAEYRARYASIGAPMLSLLPGVHETFAAVRAAGGRVLVVSAKSEPGVIASLVQLGLTGDRGPDLAVGGLFAAAKGVRLKEEGAAIYVGDHPGDVEAAQVAGATSVAVTTGPHDAEALLAAGADVVLTGLPEFPGWLASFLPGLSRSRVGR